MRLTNRQAKTLRRWVTLFGKNKPSKLRFVKMYGGFKLQAICKLGTKEQVQFELQMPNGPIDVNENCTIYSLAELLGEEEDIDARVSHQNQHSVHR